MSGPAATAFRWKKYRFDMPGHVARQSGKHLPGKFVSLPDSLPSLPWGFEKRMLAKTGFSQSLTGPSVLSNRAAGGRTKLGMGTPRHVLPDVASVVESEESRPALWGFIFSSECDDFPVLGFLEKKYIRSHIFVVTTCFMYFQTSLFLSYRESFLCAVA